LAKGKSQNAKNFSKKIFVCNTFLEKVREIRFDFCQIPQTVGTTGFEGQK
jgi:hypothetical protein